MSGATLSKIIPASRTSKGEVKKWPLEAWSAGAEVSHENVVLHRSADGVRSPENGENGAALESGAECRQEPQGNEQQRAQYAEEIDSALQLLVNPVTDISEEVFAELTALAADIAVAIVQKELQNDPGILTGMIKEALGQLPACEEVTVIRLHPRDLKSIEGICNQVTENGSLIGTGKSLSTYQIDWVPDESLSRGDIIVTCNHSVINGGVRSAVQSVCDSFCRADQEK